MTEKKNLDRKEMFSIYIDTINYERKTEHRKVTNNPKYIKKLFATFDINIISETITKNWLQKLNLGFMNYFSDVTITTQHLQNCLDFFRNNIKSNIEVIQTELLKNKTLFNYVNFTTTDTDIFFCSLIKQFLFIVKPSIINEWELTDFIVKIENKTIPFLLPM